MTFAPKSVHHQVDKLHEWIVVELLREQLIQFFEGRLESRVIIFRLNKVSLYTVGFSNLDQWNLLLEKVRKSKLARLEFCIRHLNAKRNSQVVSFRSIQRQIEHRTEIELPG